MDAGDINAALHAELPPGDDNFEAPPGQQQQKQFPGQQPFFFPRHGGFPWQQQHMIQQPQPQPHGVKLVPLLTQKVRTWFTLAELSFQTAYVVDSRMKFNLVLAALSEEALDLVKALEGGSCYGRVTWRNIL